MAKMLPVWQGRFKMAQRRLDGKISQLERKLVEMVREYKPIEMPASERAELIFKLEALEDFRKALYRIEECKTFYE
jgi:hypothetical protein